MRVPDDVTLLLCDDNWGNIRKLPKPGEPPRAGGYGIYYHFDYVGGPRNYKWLNTNQISRVWEQMHLAYEHGVDRLWIVNVGDIKPMEFPTEFFLDYAWNPDGLAGRAAGRVHAAVGGRAIRRRARRRDRRHSRRSTRDTTPVASRSCSRPTRTASTNYREAETVVADYNRLARRSGANQRRAARRVPRRLFPAGAASGRGVRESERAVRHGRPRIGSTPSKAAPRRTIWRSTPRSSSPRTPRSRATTTKSSPAASGTT